MLQKIVNYRQTPGLERYPEPERFAVWREAHQHLMRKDYSYARQHQAYLAQVAKASSLVAVSTLPLGLGVAGAVAARFLHWPVIYGVLGIVAGVVFAVAMVTRIFRLAIQQQTFMNQHVAALLRQRAATA